MAILFPMPVMQFFDDNGDPLSGGKLYTYVAGTTTPLATYTDQTGGSANANPVVLDAAGRANIWLSTTQLYYMELKDADGNLIWTADKVGTITVNADVVGPASSTNNAVVRWDGGTGKLIQNSSVTISDGGAVAADSLALNTPLPLLSGGTGANNAGDARTNLGLGDLATKGDADYGDITVSWGGTVWSIDNDAVTRDKIVDGAVNGAKLSGQQTGDAPVYGTRAWVLFNAQTSTITGQGNVSSVVDNGGGLFTVNFTTAMNNNLFASTCMFEPIGGAPTLCAYIQTRNASYLDILFVDGSYAPVLPLATAVTIIQ